MWKVCQYASAAVAALMLFATSIASAQSQTRESFEPLQKTVKVLSTNLDGFGIPFQVASKNGQFIEVQLYISRDKGKTWSFHSRQPTSAREFPFTSDGDGEYWFSIKTLDRDRRLLPDGDARPELKIVVDTKKPKLELQIESDAAGRVVCRWQASDESIDASSLKIQYRASAGELLVDGIDDSWKSVPVELKQKVQSQTWTDQLAWWPDASNEQLEVKVRVADMAGNAVTATRYVAVKRASWRTRSTGSTLNQARPSTNPPQPNVGGANDSANWQPKLRPFASPNPVIESPSPSRQKQSARTPEPVPQGSGNRWRINESAANKRSNPVAVRVAATQLPPGVELVDPPEPPGWNEPIAIEPTYNQDFSPPTPSPSKGSVSWESDVQRHETPLRSWEGSTMAPAPNIAPLARQLPSRTTDSIPSNPGTSVRSGKNIISESTTSWPDNQWKGPTAAKVQPNSELAPRTSRMVPIRRQSSSSNSNAPARDSLTQPSNISNAGFRKPQTDSSSTFSPLPAISEKMPDSANTQIIGTKRFQLNYDINAIDPSGVGQIDLWMTRDRGQTWKLWGQDPDNVSPFPVEVSEEGVYGFRIVVRSKDGLAGRGPVRGEEADMWVQVDVTAPLVKITSVPYGRGSEAGQLVINYAASDSNLVLRPNRILWSTNPDGPWTTIEENLRNDDRLLWKPGQNVPKRIFLRIETADRAGNVGIHNLEQAIDISGLIPRGTIFGVVPVGE